MKTSLSFLLSVAALAVAVAVFAQTALTVTGTVVSSSSTQVVIKTDDGRQMTFAVDAQSTVPAGLAAGNPVTVSYHDMGGGTFHAASVTVSSAGMPSSATAPAAQEPMERAGAKTRTTRRMPSTASPLPLIGLAGLLSLTAGLGLRAVRRSA